MKKLISLSDEALSATITAELTGRSALALRDLPELPLALNVEMPEGSDYPAADVGVAFDSLVLTGEGETGIVDNDGEPLLELALPPLSLSGTYRLSAKPTRAHEMDTGGTMMNLADLTDRSRERPPWFG